MLLKERLREVSKMAWPMAVGMLSYTMMGVVDTLLMGQVGTHAQAGVGLAASLAFFFISFFMGLSSGAQTLVSAADGATNKKRLNMAASTGIFVGLLAGVTVIILLGLTYTPLLEFAVSDTKIINSASLYLGTRLIGMPLTMLGIGLLAGIQGVGDTKTRMWVSLFANGLNAVLDYLFIFGYGPIPAMAEAGAGLATAFSALAGTLLYGIRYYQLFGKPILPTIEVMLSSVKVGLPIGLQHMLDMTAFMLVNFVLARVGASHLAASEIVINIASMSFLPGYGISEAGGILVGRYLGAKEKDSAMEVLKSARILAVIVMAIFGIFFALRGGWLASFFTKDPEVARIAGILMIYAAVFQVLDAIVMVNLCALRAVGDTKFSMVLTLVCAWGITVPLTLLLGLVLNWGASGTYLGLTIEIGMLALISGWRVKGIANGKVGRMDLILGER